jgi:hypothetical protein
VSVNIEFVIFWIVAPVYYGHWITFRRTVLPPKDGSRNPEDHEFLFGLVWGFGQRSDTLENNWHRASDIAGEP